MAETLDTSLYTLTDALAQADETYLTEVRAALGQHLTDINVYMDAVRALEQPDASTPQQAWQALQASRTTAMSAVTTARTARTTARSAARDAFKTAQT